MGVKTIFKVLIGTVVAIFAFGLIVEFIGSTVNGTQFNTDLRKSVLSACEFYSQETFRTSDGRVSMQSGVPGIAYKSNDGTEVELKDDSGNSYSKFYDGVTAEDIYKGLYDSTEARNQINEMLDKTKNDVKFEQDEIDMQVSPLNLGVPYMDKDALERIARYILCRTLASNSSSAVDLSDSIVYDSIGQWRSEHGDNTVYIKRGGFLVDINTFTINKIDYSYYDLGDETGREAFEKLTGWNVEDDNSHGTVCVARIDCSVDILYEGAGLLQTLIEAQSEVFGVQGQGDSERTLTLYDQYNDDKAGANMNGTTSSRLNGSIYYYNIT